jgi:hypothetical protein
VRVVLRHAVLWRRQRRAHGLLHWLLLLLLRLLSIELAYWREVEVQRGQRIVGVLRRPSVGLMALLALLWRGIGIGGLH